MKTLQEQYNLIQEGKGHKDVFMKSARRLFPEYITNFATYQEATKILKQKSILSEAVGGIVTQTSANPFINWKKFLNEESLTKDELISKYGEDLVNFVIKMDRLSDEEASDADYIDDRIQIHLEEPEIRKKFLNEEAKAEEKKTTKEVEEMETKGYDYKDPKNTDNLNFEEMLRGYYVEMKDPKNADKTEEQLREMVAKNLAKDPSFYVKDGAFGVKGIGYTDDVPGLKVSNKELKGEYASSGMEKVKMNESKNSSLNEGWMDLLTYGPLAVTAALSALSLATDTAVKDMPSKAKDEVSNFDLKSISKGIKAKWREYTNPKVYKIIQKIVNDPEIVSAAETLILGPRGGKRFDRMDKAYRNALEAKLTPEEIDTLKKFLENIKKDYNWRRRPDLKKAKSLGSLKKYAAGDNIFTGDDIFEGKKTKTKKESTESKLAEIEKQGRIVTMEAQIEALDELINSKTQRLSMISEDEDLSEIADKGKLKEMQREVKELQKRKMKMEKLYEKMCGKSYSKPEIVDEEVDSDTMSKAEKGDTNATTAVALDQAGIPESKY